MSCSMYLTTNFETLTCLCIGFFDSWKKIVVSKLGVKFGEQDRTLEINVPNIDMAVLDLKRKLCSKEQRMILPQFFRKGLIS